MLGNWKKFLFCCSLVLLGVRGFNFAQSLQISSPANSELQVELKKIKPYPQVRWSRGVVTLSNMGQISGYLCYEPQTELLLVYEQGKVLTLSSYQVKKFKFFDETLQLERRYQTLPDTMAGRRRTRIFEVIVPGAFSLLRQETNGNGAYKRSPVELVDKLNFNYFIWDGNKVWPFLAFQKQMLPALAHENDAFKELSKHRKSPNLPEIERRRIIAQLNKINKDFGSEATLAHNDHRGW